MIRWNNDYNHGAHPNILKALEETNSLAFAGYGRDEWCLKAEKRIKDRIKSPDADVHFLLGGTGVNYTLIAAALRPFESVISADSGHINAHETGAVENTGHKIETLPHKDGKITAEQIQNKAYSFMSSGVKEHITKPRLVFLSFPTEYGTVYSKKELCDIRRVCDECGLLLYIDGARLGYGLGSEACDVSIEDISALSDAFYIGGTKCGALFGEALVINNPVLKPNFRSYMKQNGSMLAKGWLLGLQFYTLFEDDLYFKITEKATKNALKIKKAFTEKGLEMYPDSPTNQQFVLLSKDQMEILSRNHIYEYQEPMGDKHLVRFCTSVSTLDSDIDTLIADINNL